MAQKLRTIRLYGELGHLFGREFKLAVNSTAEAVRALCTMLPGFEAHLMGSKDRGVGYAVFLGKENITEDKLIAPVGNAPIRIAPIIGGRKNGGWLNIIVGVVLVVVGVLAMTFGAVIGGDVWGPYLISAGVGMIAGGIVQLLSPQPKHNKPKESPANDPNANFSGPINTQAQGQPVAILLGELIVGSAVISAGLEAKDNAYIPSTNTSGSGQGSKGGGGSAPWHLEWMAA